LPAKDPFREDFVSRRRVYAGKAVGFVVDTVRLPDGKTATREFMDHPGAVAALPLADPRTVVLVEQYRHPVGETTLEIPAGKLDAGEKPLVCVKRELREETGYTAARIRPFLAFWPTAAFSNELIHIYLAEGLKAGRSSPDEDEFLRVVHMPLDEALRLVWNGRIRDSKTVIALSAFAARKKA
jgi:ADP-ribose pyrophosphatase